MDQSYFRGSGGTCLRHRSEQHLVFRRLPLPPAPMPTAFRVQKQVDIAKRNSVWRREYMNWEMTLSVERDKGRKEGRYEGEMLNSIRLILSKLSKGKTEEVIADEIERDVTFVQLINSLSETMDSPTPEAVFNAYKTLNTDGKFDAFESLPAD